MHSTDTPSKLQGESAHDTSRPQPPSQRADSPRADLRALLGEARFRTLFVAHLTSNLGDWLAFMALFSLSTFEWNVGVRGVSVLGVAYMLPFAIVSPWAGVLVDRWDLRRVLIGGDLLRAGLVAAMAFTSQFPVLATLLFLHQVVASFFNPAQHASIPRLVPRERLLAANALNAQAAQITKILGPGVAGALVALLGVRGCFFLDAASFGLSAALLVTLPAMRSMRVPAPSEGSFRGDFVLGVDTLLRTSRLRAAVAMLALDLCALGAFVAVLPVFARDHFGAGPRLMGLLLSALGVGAAVGAFAVLHVGKRWDKLRIIAAGMLLCAVSFATLSVVTTAFWGGVATALVGVATAALVVPAHALFQDEVPAALLARVLSLALAALAISQAVGMLLAGAAGGSFATPALLRGAAAVLLLGGVPAALWSRYAAAARPGLAFAWPRNMGVSGDEKT